MCRDRKGAHLQCRLKTLFCKRELSIRDLGTTLTRRFWASVLLVSTNGKTACNGMLASITRNVARGSCK